MLSLFIQEVFVNFSLLGYSAKPSALSVCSDPYAIAMQKQPPVWRRSEDRTFQGSTSITMSNSILYYSL
jgi:hypothetical protein